MCLTLVIALGLGQVPVLTIKEAYQHAQIRNLDLKAARARLQQANLLREKVWTNQLPRVEILGTYAHNSREFALEGPNGYYLRTVGTTSLNGPSYDPSQAISTSNPPGTPSNTIIVPSGYDKTTLLAENQVSGALTISLPLLVPELWPKFHEAALGLQLAEASVEQARGELLFGVAQLYYGAASLKEAVGAQERILENARAHEREAQTRVQAGALPRIGLVRAQIDRIRAEQDVLRSRNSYAAARSALAALLDRDAQFEVTRPDEPAVPDALSDADADERTLARRTDLEVARHQLEVSEASARSVLFKYAPSLGATGVLRGTSTNAFGPSHEMWSVSLSLRWIVWDGGAREVELKENRLKALEASAALASATAKAKDEVRRAVLELASARANRIKAQEQLALARENDAVVSRSFSAGAASPIDLSDATTSLANAEVAVVAESLNAQLAALRLLRATGLFSPVEQ